MSRAFVYPAAKPLRGTVHVPGDKSISHRRALLSLYTDERVCLANFNPGADCGTSLTCLEKLGKLVRREKESVTISGRAEFPTGELYCGNSGTTARLLMGILAGRRGEWTLCGDESLSRRPMERVAEPLRKMGARITLANGCLPARMTGSALRGVEYSSPTASAQVKSAVILAALQAAGITRYCESARSRDHTERILELSLDPDGRITVDPERIRIAGIILSASIPGDPSAAAFWVAAALLVPESELTISGVLLNPTRIAYLEALQKSGADISINNPRDVNGESAGDISVRYAPINGFKIDRKTAVMCMDEVPVLAVLAATAQGNSEFDGVGELRIKESDRLQVIVENLRRMGVYAAVNGDHLSMNGAAVLQGAEIETAGDHRMAMAFAVAGLAARGRTTINDLDCARISYPEFWLEMERLVPGGLTRED